MSSRSLARDRDTGLLARPPSGSRAEESDWEQLMVDPIEQLEELADLCTRGFLSREEFEDQKARILRR